MQHVRVLCFVDYGTELWNALQAHAILMARLPCSMDHEKPLTSSIAGQCIDLSIKNRISWTRAFLLFLLRVLH